MATKATARENKRYLAFMVDTGAPVDAVELKKELFTSIFSFIGELGFSQADPKLIEFNQKTSMGIIKCSVERLDSVRCSLSLLKSISGRMAAIRLLGNSGTLKSLRGAMKRERVKG